MIDEEDYYGHFIDIELGIDIITQITQTSNNNKKNDDVNISEKSIKNQYLIVTNFFCLSCFCIFTIIYFYASPPFR